MKWILFSLLILNIIFFGFNWFTENIKEMIGFGVLILFLTNILLQAKDWK